MVQIRVARTPYFRVGLSVLLLLSAFVPSGTRTVRAAPSAVDEGWIVSWPQSLGYQGVRFRDVPEYNESVSTLRARSSSSGGWWKSCSSLSEDPCATAPFVEFSAVLQPCVGPLQVDCLVEFGVLDAGGNKVGGTFQGRFPSQGLNDFAAESSIGLPEGGPAGIWTLPVSTGLTVREHLVRAVVAGERSDGGKLVFTNFAANISSVTVKQFPCGRSEHELATGCRTGDTLDLPENHGGEEGWWGYSDGVGYQDGFDCVLTGNLDSSSQTADCAERRALPKDTTYYITVRLSQGVSGWMHGRMADPTISYTDFSQVPGAVTLSMSGKPVSVPSVVLDMPYEDLPSNLQDSYRFNGGWPRTGGGYWDPAGGGGSEDPSDPLMRIRRSLPSPFGRDAISELEAWLPVVNDTAIADPTQWTVRSLGYDIGPQYGCVSPKNRITGIVTTNSTLYRAGTPEFDSASQTLNYTVAAPHYMSSGEVFRGMYSLIIRSDLARCIYGFSSAPIKATVEVVDSGSEKISAVTNVFESGGWIKLSATGFTHSTPTIKTKFTQSDGSLRSVVGRTITREAIVGSLGKSVVKGSRLAISVATSSKKVCRMVGTSVRATSKGSCRLVVTVFVGKRKAMRSVVIDVS